jgi:hypothetical protein
MGRNRAWFDGTGVSLILQFCTAFLAAVLLAAAISVFTQLTGLLTARRGSRRDRSARASLEHRGRGQKSLGRQLPLRPADHRAGSGASLRRRHHPPRQPEKREAPLLSPARVERQEIKKQGLGNRSRFSELMPLLF